MQCNAINQELLYDFITFLQNFREQYPEKSDEALFLKRFVNFEINQD